MPKKQNLESQEQQSERFRKAVSDLVDAGDLNPAEADATMEKMVRAGARKRPESDDSSQ